MLAARRQWTAFCWGIAVCVGVYVAVGLLGSAWDDAEDRSRGYQAALQAPKNKTQDRTPKTSTPTAPKTPNAPKFRIAAPSNDFAANISILIKPSTPLPARSQPQIYREKAIPNQRRQNESLNPQIPVDGFLIHLPHLHDSHDIQPIIHMAPSQPRSPRLLFGIPTVSREKKDYLRRTLASLLSNLQPSEWNAVAYIVMFAERDPKTSAKRVETFVRWLRLKYPEHVEKGLITVLSVPANFYPPKLDEIPPSMNDSQKRTVWRTKQGLDFAYLMSFATAQYPDSDYYVQLEDDVVTVKDYAPQMLRFADEGQGWLTCDFTTLGFIGKLFHIRDLPLFVHFTMINYKAKPIDWILEQLFDNIFCGPETGRGFRTKCKITKSQRRVHRRPLFQHIGWFSSLDGKIQKLKVKGFSAALNQGDVADDLDVLERLAAQEQVLEELKAKEEEQKRRESTGKPSNQQGSHQKPIVGNGKAPNDQIQNAQKPKPEKSPAAVDPDPRPRLPPAAALANLALNFMGSMGASMAGAAADGIQVRPIGEPELRPGGSRQSNPQLSNGGPASPLLPGQAVDLANLALNLLNPTVPANSNSAAGPQPMDLADMALGLMGVPQLPAPTSPNAPPTVPAAPVADLPRLIGSLMQSAQTGQPMSLQDTMAAMGAAQQLITAVPGLQDLVANQQIDPLTAIQGLQEVFGGGATPAQVAEGIQRMMGGVMADAAATLATAAMRQNMEAYGNQPNRTKIDGQKKNDGKPAKLSANSTGPKSKSEANPKNSQSPKKPADVNKPAETQRQPKSTPKTEQKAVKNEKPVTAPPILETMPVDSPPPEKPKNSLASSDLIQLLDVLEDPANVQRVLDGDQQRPNAKRKTKR